jgi:hypothetical protein
MFGSEEMGIRERAKHVAIAYGCMEWFVKDRVTQLCVLLVLIIELQPLGGGKSVMDRWIIPERIINVWHNK